MGPLKANRDYRKEFSQLGRDQVRSDLLYGRYSAEKNAAARVWLEQADAESWQKGHVPREKESLLRNKNFLKAVPIIGAGAMILFTLVRWLR